MGLIVNTNLSSLTAQKSLASNSASLQKSMEKLSTGMRINSASDDAAGLTISEKFRSQYRGADVALSNAQNGNSMLQTAEGDLSVIQDNLQRVRDLTVQAANDTNSSAERNAIVKEVQARFTEINRIAKGSSFNGIKLLSGANSNGLHLQVGANKNDIITADAFDAATVGANGLNIAGTAGTKLTNSTDATAWLDEIDKSLKTVSQRRSDIGSLQNRLASTMDSLSITSQNLKAADSNIRDVDVAKESSKMVKSQILQQASATLLAQANQTPSLAMSLI